MKIALQASNGLFVCAEGGGGSWVFANRSAIADWETFEVLPVGDGRIALRTHGGQYLRAEYGGGNDLTANGQDPSAWQQFTPAHDIRDGEPLTLLVHDGEHYVGIGGDGTDAHWGRRMGREDFWDHRALGPRTADPNLVHARHTEPQAFTVTVLEGAPVVGDAPRIRVEGKRFLSQDGAWQWGMNTDFRLLRRVLDGEDISPILEQRRERGSNGVRVLGMAHYLFALSPQSEPGFWDGLHALFTQLGKYGMACEWTCFADAQIIMRDVGQQRAHWTQTVAVARNYPHVVVELGNELDKNGIDPRDFVQPVGLVSCRGSQTQEEPIPMPPWSYATFRERRDEWKNIGRGFKAQEAVWDREDDHPPYDIPCVFNEPIGAAEWRIEGRRDNQPTTFAALAAQYRAVGAGATFHSEAGLQSVLWGPAQDRCALAFYQALFSAY